LNFAGHKLSPVFYFHENVTTVLD